MKFISDKQPKDHAERLHKLQSKIAIKRAELKALEREADQLEAYLFRINKGKSFMFNGALYQKVVKIIRGQRMILDQDECKRLLKSRTPYKPIETLSVKVDYVYED